MANEDILSAAAATTQQMTPPERDLTSFGPTPLVAPPPLPRFTPQQPQFAKAGNEFQTVSGRKRADRQATISGVANFIKAGGDYIQAKKQRDLSMTIERLMSAQAGLEEAKAAGNQEGIQKNTAIINDITSDPKKVKQLQKAFNIDLFGTGKNQNENKALMEAWKNFQAEKNKNPNTLNPAAQRLMASQPYRQQLSPEAQAQAMAIKAGLVPKAGEILKAYQDNFKILMTAKDVDSRNAAMESLAKIHAQAVQYHADKILEANNVRAMGAQGIAELRMRTEKYRADSIAKTWDKRLQMMDTWTKMKTGDSPVFKKMLGEAKTYNDRLKEIVTENTKLQGELDKKGSSFLGIKFGAASDPDSKMMRQKIMLNNLESQQLQNNLNSVTKKMQTLDTMGAINMKELSTGSSGGNGESGDTDQVEVEDTEVPE